MPAEPAPLILGFDTSGPHCAAALIRGGDLLGAYAEEMTRGQVERLMPLIENLLADHSTGWSDLAAVGVGIGPGNFTGIRVAVSAARGLALGLKVPAIGVSVFDALTRGETGARLATVAAPRGQAYLRRFGTDDDSPELLDAEALAALPGDLSHHRYPDDLTPPALAEAIARVALDRLGSDQPRPAPLYIRGADAAPPSDPPPVILP